MFKKNELLNVKITDMTNEGEGIGKVDGFTFFVKDAIIGDEATIRVTKVKKNYGYARLEKLLAESSYRVEPECPVARQCGGCQIQAMAYDKQLEFKENKVKNNLIRIGGFSKEAIDSMFEGIIGMEGSSFRYRNKAQYPIGKSKDGKIISGFYAGRTHSIIPVEDCLLGDEVNKDIINEIISWMNQYNISPYDEVSHKGLIRHVLIRKGYYTKEIMVCLVINAKDIPKKQELIDSLEKIKGVESISLSSNENDTNVIMGDNYRTIWGKDTITDKLLGLTYEISPLSFYQVNPVQVERLYQTAIDYAGLKGEEEVWDLCCGIGTITLSMASMAKMVHGIEIVPQAIEDARKNAVRNGIENSEFISAAIEEYLPANSSSISADVIVMDPPRKGIDEKALEVVVGASPKIIVYVSCDSATLARDLKYLCEKGYELKRVKAVDMFPHTGHVETVCLLSRK
ncbi:MAG: 23S rRNA (uracil(1939)-C(5))-methyltransferase RlmD [Lachnospiraceae bacterium]|nr:23S rRNA (uracil(1939)-C(5))-methyltransferase RlmD [Lachnospiraceae bacterium]